MKPPAMCVTRESADDNRIGREFLVEKVEVSTKTPDAEVGKITGSQQRL